MTCFPPLREQAKRQRLCGECKRGRCAQVETEITKRYPPDEHSHDRDSKHREGCKPGKIGSIRAETLRDAELLCESDDSCTPVPCESSAETVSSEDDSC